MSIYRNPTYVQLGFWKEIVFLQNYRTHKHVLYLGKTKMFLTPNNNIILVGWAKHKKSYKTPQNQGLRETSSRFVNANDRSWCFSAHFGFGCLDLAFLNNCWVKTLIGRKDTPTPVIGIRRPVPILRRALLQITSQYK